MPGRHDDEFDMTQEQLTRLLHQRTADEPVGPPPLTDMHRAVVRRRRGRGRGAVLGVVAAVVLVGGSLAALDGRASDGDGDGSAVTRPVTDPERPPAGFRWVGLGHAAIAVPEDWGSNALRCGTPTRDTAIVDVGVICAADFPYPAGTSSVEVSPAGALDDDSDYAPTEVDGARALASPLECSGGGIQGTGTCRQRLLLPDLDVVFSAESSRGRAAVSAILDRVSIVAGEVAVPGFQRLADDRQGRSGAAYVRALRATGFATVVRTRDGRGFPAGYVLEAQPAPGTMVEPGSTVTVTVARP